MRLIIATQNPGKLREIKHLLKGVKFSIVSLNELGRKFNIKENEKTFFENAVKKTLPISKAYKDNLVAGEDSGLVVDYLGGKPGVFSKRYSGKKWTYHKNNLKILKELEGVERKKRKAHFICYLVLIKNGKIIKKIEGQLNGFIHNEIKGKGGFGYDPIFYLPKYKKTVAELPLSEKNKISHRALAFLKLKQYLTNMTLGTD
ncbi:MAG: RdgB/HAM1 family non-canonical purine NTP pyrophosphatase [Candidatus Omnitrophota bacterium]|nr:RdgB/HAM1 family non-canonical purine NTP pyrophosphatase [Candidatus Omnitrophota bacterium]